jgi:hypothetical protein
MTGGGEVGRRRYEVRNNVKRKRTYTIIELVRQPRPLSGQSNKDSLRTFFEMRSSLATGLTACDVDMAAIVVMYRGYNSHSYSGRWTE